MDSNDAPYPWEAKVTARARWRLFCIGTVATLLILLSPFLVMAVFSFITEAVSSATGWDRQAVVVGLVFIAGSVFSGLAFAFAPPGLD